ncbi:MAG: DoxX family protein [Candidatus Binatia bacterium]|nr:DoxX family protein [Candidatus Binatia bacterium]
MEQGVLTIIETVLRIILGLRFLCSGVSNVRRWPHAAQTASIVIPQAPVFFGLIATALMVLGGSGMALGFQTHIAGLMLVIFLIPTLQVQRHWLQVLPAASGTVESAITGEEAKSQFKFFSRHAIHGHETGWQNNLVLLLAALFFSVRGSIAYGLDNVLTQWVIRFL